MPYTYEYTENCKQFGMIHLIIKLIDSDNILPEINFPVVLNENEYNDELLNNIGLQLIESNTPKILEEILVTDPVVTENTTISDIGV